MLFVLVTLPLGASYGVASFRLRLKTARYAAFGFSPSLQSIRTYAPMFALLPCHARTGRCRRSN